MRRLRSLLHILAHRERALLARLNAIDLRRIMSAQSPNPSDVGVGGCTAFQKDLHACHCSIPPPPPALFRLVPHTSSSFCGDSVPRSIHRIPAFSASSSRFPHRGVPQHLPRCSTGHNRSAPFLRQHLISAAQRLHLDAVMAM